MAQDLPPTIESVRNRKNGKLFVIVDDTLESRYKLINPQGEMIILPDLLFDEDPITVPKSEFEAEFSPEQLEALEKHLIKQAALAAAEALRPTPPRVVETVREAPARKPRSMGKAVPKTSTRSGLGAQWNSPRLSFYKHKIDPLQPKQTMRITVEGLGVFEISKEDFLNTFNEVVMSPSYRADGLYTYPSMPEKAKRFLRTS